MPLTLIDCILDNALKGLKARKVRIVLNIGMFPTPAQPATKLVHETLIKSSFICVFFKLSTRCKIESFYQYKKITINLTTTITKSSQHQAFVKYFTKPSANHLTHISRKKVTVNIRSI